MLTSDLDDLSLVADVAHFELIATLGIDGKVTLKIADGTLLAAQHLDGSANDGLASLVNHNTLNTCSLLNTSHSTIRHRIVYWRTS